MMGLGLSSEHLDLAEAVRRWSDRHCPAGSARAAAAGRPGPPHAEPGDGPEAGGPAGPDAAPAWYNGTLRPLLAEQGLLGLHLPEAHGGQGYGITELAVALEELGRALVPGGYLPTVLASAVLASAGPAAGNEPQKLIAGLAGGSVTGAVSLAPGLAGRAGPRDGLILDGTSSPVLGASLADLVILPARTDQGEVWAAVDTAGLEVTELDSLDLTRPSAQVSAEGVFVPADRILTGLSTVTASTLAATLFGAEACGIADWAVRTAAEYAKIRHQFGRPIGQFQAVKHRCAWMLTAAEQAAATVWDAARANQPATDGTPGREAEFAAAVAAAVAVDAAVNCAHECIQVLGGIGYTWEHDAHLYYRRALSLRALLGPSREWARRAADLALDGVSRPIQVDLPAAAEPLRAEVREELATLAALEPPARTERLAGDGWLTPHLPRPWGRGAEPLEQVIIAQEMKAAGLRGPALFIGAWVIPALVQYGTPEQQQRFLPPTLRGEIIWCQLFSEPGAGSDLAGLSTRAERVDGGWRLTGQKIWTSLAKEAAWAICVARTDPAAPKHEGITYFLVDMKTPGVTVRPLREITGDAMFNEVFLDGVFVPDRHVVGEINGGWRVARTTLANERVSLSQSWTFGCGVPELLDAVRHLGREPGQSLLEQAGRLVSEGHAIALLGIRVTLKQLSGTEPGATGSVRKLLSMRHAQQIAEACWSMQGADGALASAPWTRQTLFTRALTIGGGTTDIQLNIIGERILGLPRDPEPTG
jgi:alkylation response protein AidB-like acyl-CoA dehydrogenase